MFKRFVAVLVVAMLAGCGGGGGGDSSQGTPPGSYTGNRSEAVITTSNAKSMATSAYSLTTVAGSFDVLGKAAVEEGSVQSPLLQEVVAILDETAASAVAGPKTTAKSAEAVVSEAGNIYGYTGYAAYDVTVNTVSGSASGSISFVNYSPDSYSATLNGRVTFAGEFYSDSSSLKSFKMTFGNIVISRGTASLTMSGSFEASNSGLTQVNKMTLFVTDNVSSRSAFLDYTLTLSNDGWLTCTGTFYDSVHGYVTVSTPNPLRVSSISSTPTSGRLLVTGSNGTKARLTFSSGGYYLVEVDAAGNGTFVAAP